MSRFVLPLLLVAQVVQTALPPMAGAHNGEVAVAVPVAGIIVDGDLGDWPETLRSHRISRPETGTPPRDSTDFHGRFRVAYDPQRWLLYVAVEVVDESTVIVTGGAWDRQDGCEVYLATGHEEDGAALPTQFNLRGDDEVEAGVAAVRRTEGSHVYEWALPIGPTGAPAGEDLRTWTVGFDIVVCDRDGDGSFSWVAWGPKTGKVDSVDRVGDVLLMVDMRGWGVVEGRAQRVLGSGAGTARVQYRGLPSGPSGYAITDTSGAFRIELPEGRYEFGSENMTHAVAAVSRSQISQLTLLLPAAPDPQGSEKYGFTEEIATGQFVTGVHVGKDRTLWIATDRGLSRVDDLGLKTYTEEHGLFSSNLTAIAEDSEGNLWLGTRWAGAVRFNGQAFVQFTAADGLADDRVRAVYIDREENVWFGTWGGVTRYDGAGFFTYRVSEDPQDPDPRVNEVTCLMQDRDGRMWFGTWQGVGFIEDGRLVIFTLGHIGYKGVTCLIEDRDGVVWIGTYVGLSRFDGSGPGPVPVPIDEGLASRRVTALAADAAGRLWLGTWEAGLAVYSGRVFQTLSTTDGLVHHAVTDLARGHDGDLWIATENGVSRYRPPPYPPLVELLDVVTDRGYGAVDRIRLPLSQTIAFSFRGLSSTTHPTRLAFLYRLRGHEQEWRATREGRAEYNGLATGDYAFEVQVLDRDLNPSAIAEVRVTVHTPYRVLALTGALGLAVAGLVAATGYAVKQRRERNRARQALVHEMEEELRTAHNMQMGLMPRSALRIAGFEAAGRCVPANHVGGDFFQYFPRDGRLVTCMADVTGHAMEAAIPVVLFSGILDNQMENYRGLEELFGQLNRSLYRLLGKRTFICFAMAEMDAHTHRLRLANAACPPPYHFRAATGEVSELQTGDYPLGVSSRSTYRVREVALEPGDRVVFCSDGLEEAESREGELFGSSRVVEVLRDGCHAGLAAGPLLGHLFDLVERFAGDMPARDDRTCVVIEVKR